MNNNGKEERSEGTEEFVLGEFMTSEQRFCEYLDWNAIFTMHTAHETKSPVGDLGAVGKSFRHVTIAGFSLVTERVMFAQKGGMFKDMDDGLLELIQKNYSTVPTQRVSATPFCVSCLADREIKPYAMNKLGVTLHPCLACGKYSFWMCHSKFGKIDVIQLDEENKPCGIITFYQVVLGMPMNELDMTYFKWNPRCVDFVNRICGLTGEGKQIKVIEKPEIPPPRIKGVSLKWCFERMQPDQGWTGFTADMSSYTPEEAKEVFQQTCELLRGDVPLFATADSRILFAEINQHLHSMGLYVKPSSECDPALLKAAQDYFEKTHQLKKSPSDDQENQGIGWLEQQREREVASLFDQMDLLEDEMKDAEVHQYCSCPRCKQENEQYFALSEAQDQVQQRKEFCSADEWFAVLEHERILKEANQKQGPPTCPNYPNECWCVECCCVQGPGDDEIVLGKEGEKEVDEDPFDPDFPVVSPEPLRSKVCAVVENAKSQLGGIQAKVSAKVHKPQEGWWKWLKLKKLSNEIEIAEDSKTPIGKFMLSYMWALTAFTGCWVTLTSFVLFTVLLGPVGGICLGIATGLGFRIGTPTLKKLGIMLLGVVGLEGLLYLWIGWTFFLICLTTGITYATTKVSAHVISKRKREQENQGFDVETCFETACFGAKALIPDYRQVSYVRNLVSLCRDIPMLMRGLAAFWRGWNFDIKNCYLRPGPKFCVYSEESTLYEVAGLSDNMTCGQVTIVGHLLCSFDDEGKVWRPLDIPSVSELPLNKMPRTLMNVNAMIYEKDPLLMEMKNARKLTVAFDSYHRKVILPDGEIADQVKRASEYVKQDSKSWDKDMAYRYSSTQNQLKFVPAKEEKGKEKEDSPAFAKAPGGMLDKITALFDDGKEGKQSIEVAYAFQAGSEFAEWVRGKFALVRPVWWFVACGFAIAACGVGVVVYFAKKKRNQALKHASGQVTQNTILKYDVDPSDMITKFEQDGHFFAYDPVRMSELAKGAKPGQIVPVNVVFARGGAKRVNMMVTDDGQLQSFRKDGWETSAPTKLPPDYPRARVKRELGRRDRKRINNFERFANAVSSEKLQALSDLSKDHVDYKLTRKLHKVNLGVYKFERESEMVSPVVPMEKQGASTPELDRYFDGDALPQVKQAFRTANASRFIYAVTVNNENYGFVVKTPDGLWFPFHYLDSDSKMSHLVEGQEVLLVNTQSHERAQRIIWEPSHIKRINDMADGAMMKLSHPLSHLRAATKFTVLPDGSHTLWLNGLDPKTLEPWQNRVTAYKRGKDITYVTPNAKGICGATLSLDQDQLVVVGMHVRGNERTEAATASAVTPGFMAVLENRPGDF